MRLCLWVFSSSRRLARAPARTRISFPCSPVHLFSASYLRRGNIDLFLVSESIYRLKAICAILSNKMSDSRDLLFVFENELLKTAL